MSKIVILQSFSQKMDGMGDLCNIYGSEGENLKIEMIETIYLRWA